MGKKRKKKQPKQPAAMSPKRYVKEKARKLPLGPCYASQDLSGSDGEKGLFQIIITRAKPSGKFAIGVYLVDVWCLGLKNTFLQPNADEDALAELVDTVSASEDQPVVAVEYAWAHHLIYGAIAYAKSLGFEPNKDFALTRYVLEPEEAIEDTFNFEFGKDGEPLLIVGPRDNGPKLIATLRQTVGEDNFTYIMPMGGDTLLG
jgi:hypothetical protein